MALALAARPSVHGQVAQYLIYVRRSYKAADSADVSDEQQETAARGLVPPGAPCLLLATQAATSRARVPTGRDTSTFGSWSRPVAWLASRSTT